jgi:hypothetical protein
MWELGGAYEPPDRDVLAVEPSSVMIAQRSANAAPMVRAVAEALPLDNDRVNAVMAILSDQLWGNRRQGLCDGEPTAPAITLLGTLDRDSSQAARKRNRLRIRSSAKSALR